MPGFSLPELPVLTTDRLLLRPISADDFEALFWLRSADGINDYINRVPPKNIDDVATWFEKTMQKAENDQLFYWAICLKERPSLIGTACLFDLSDEKFSAEIGYELHPDFQKKGLASEAVRAVIEFCFDRLSINLIEAFIQKENASSIKMIEKQGFELDHSQADEIADDFSIYSLKKQPISQ